IDAAEPFCLPEKVEAERVLRVDERLGLAVPPLLHAISGYCIAAEMPHHGGRAKADDIAGVLKAPADVDVVARGAIDWVETAEPDQRLAAEGHVAAGDVLRDFVAEQYMRRTAGCDGDDGRDERVLGRWKVG